MSVKQWIERIGAIGIKAKAGKFGGTYAHKDIAFEFGTWVSPLFKLLLLKEFQRLKEEEALRLNTGWDIRRMVSKAKHIVTSEIGLIEPKHLFRVIFTINPSTTFN